MDNKRAGFLLFALLMFEMQCYAILAQLDHHVTKQGQNIYVFHEFHHPITEKDHEQLTSMTRALEVRSRQSTKPLHLLVEVPSLLTQTRNGSDKVTAGIINTIHSMPSITASNVEMRCISLAALYLLSRSNNALNQENQLAQERYNAGNRWCTLGDITFDSVLQELDRYKPIVDDGFSHFPQARLQIVPQKIEKLNGYQRIYEGTMRQYSINPQTRIIELSKQLSSSELGQQKRDGLYQSIDDLCNCLFDLCALRCLDYRSPSDIALIAGALHSTWLSEGLIRLNTKMTSIFNSADYLTISPLTFVQRSNQESRTESIYPRTTINKS